MEHSKDNQVIARYAYSLDPMGKRTKLIEEVYGNTPTTTTSTWQYDDLNRLVSETVNGETTSHEYDAVSNRVKQNKDGQETSYTYDVNDRLTQETGAKTASYTYDKQGNTLTQTVNGVLSNYAYNARNELISTNSNNETVSFGYDIDGIRSSKAKSNINLQFTTDNTVKNPVVLLEKQNNQVVAQYSYGNNLTHQFVNGKVSYFLKDALGSVKLLTDANAKITDSYNYSSYGQLVSKTGITDNIYLFSSEQFDRSLNQYYLRSRYYDPSIGRFTQQDEWQGKIANPITLNKYLYAHASPTNYTDPSGKFALAFNFAPVSLTSASYISFATTTAMLTTAIYLEYTMLNREINMDILMMETHSENWIDDPEATAEYERYKEPCDYQPEGNSCSEISEAIDHVEWCIAGYEAWDRKWKEGRHAIKIAGWKNRANNLKEEHQKKCVNN